LLCKKGGGTNFCAKKGISIWGLNLDALHESIDDDVRPSPVFAKKKKRRQLKKL